jgi:subtilisin family serine protease
VAFVQEVGHFKAKLSYGLDRIDQRDLPLSGTYTPGADGSGVHAFVVDTGCPAGGDLTKCRQDHGDFGARYAAECFTAVPFRGCFDAHGHGTHVAGTIGGTEWGVAKNVTLHAARVLDENGSGTTDGVIAGIDWVTAFKNANPGVGVVSNMSLGGSADAALDDAVCRSIAAGVVHVVAAGNESADAAGSSPAHVLQAITMGASDSSDHIASFSNFGALIDAFGPGVDIESDRPDGGTATFSGTSMASPHGAGAAALYLQRHPGSSPAEVEAGLKGNATPGKIGTAPADTTQALLYVRE